jgi:hypothetical protein
MYGLEGDLFYLSRSTLQYGVKKAKKEEVILAFIKRKLILEPLSRSCHVRGTAEKRTAKSDPIFRNQLVNIVVNRIMKDGKHLEHLVSIKN